MRRVATAVVVSIVAATPTACADHDERDRAVETLVELRGMDPGVAACTVGRLEQRGTDLRRIGDGRVDPIADRDIVEVVTACSVLESGITDRG